MEELDFKALLDRFKKDGFTRCEQVVLANFGTNQTLLSIIFGKPCELRLMAQKETEGVINRLVHLVFGDTLGCVADTIIPRDRNRQDIIDNILAGQLGLGQIVVTHNLPCRRKLLSIGRDKESFWRTYAIEGPEVYLEIHEHFPRLPFVAVGWLEPQEAPVPHVRK